jgi:anti-anti-sigma regulatory factor
MKMSNFSKPKTMNIRAFKIQSRKDKKSGLQYLILEGEIGINHIENIKNKIGLINFESKEIVIELKDIVSFDLSTFQLLYSLKKSLVKNGKIVKINSDIPAASRIILKNAGMTNLFEPEK